MGEPDPLIGSTVGGRFQVEAKLGQGGMAVVYRAVDQTSGQVVALKVLPAELVEHTEYVQRFLREARATQGMDHPNVIRVYGQGKEGKRPFYAMEYLPHPDLEQVLKQRGRLPPLEALEVGIGLTRALQVTHERNLYHRDIKPANVVLAPGPRPVLMDFGLVRDINRTQLTATGTVVGTPLYMSPELLGGDKAEAPSDIYQVGLLFYEMLAGEAAHRGKTMMEVANRVLDGDVIPLSQHCPDLPAAWVNLVHNMIGHTEDLRYASAEEVLRDLVRVRRGEPVERKQGSEVTSDFTAERAAADSGAAKVASTMPLSSSSGAARPGSGVRPSLSASGVAMRESTIVPMPVEPPPFPAWIKPAVVFCLLVVVGMVADFSGDHRPTDVELEPGLTTLRVTWKTADPCASLVELRRGGEGAEWVPYRAADEDPGGVTEHVVDMGELVQGEALELRIVPPGGPPRPARSLRMPRFSLGDLQVEAADPSADPGEPVPLRLRYTTTTKMECFVTVTQGGDEQELPVETEDGRTHSVELDLTGGRQPGLALLATNTAGDIVELDLRERLAEHVEGLVDALAGLDAGQVVRDLFLDPDSAHHVQSELTKNLRDETQDQARQREALTEEALLTYVRQNTPHEALRQLQLLAGWALAAASPLDPRLKARAYSRLDEAFELAWFAREHRMPRLFRRTPQDWGMFQETEASRMGPGAPVVTIYEGSDATFGTVLASSQGEFEFELPAAVAPEAMVELELVTARMMKDEMALRLHFAEGVAVTFFGRRLRINDKAKVRFHGMPGVALKPGKQRVRAELVNMFANVNAKTIDVLALRLRLPKS